MDCPSLQPIGNITIDSTGYVGVHGKLRLDGIQLVDEYGEAIQLVGFSSHGLHFYPDCYTYEALSYMVKNWGITVFRAAVYVEEFGYSFNPTYVKNLLYKVVNWCERLGIYVIIDWHVLDPGDPNFYLTSPGASTGMAADFWREMASKYKDKKHVLYEICNEPNDASLPDNIPWSTVKLYLNSIIAAIRAIDPETIIIAGTPSWSQDVQYPAEDPVDQSYNVMYTFHFYAGTHSFLFSRIEYYSTVIPIFVSEWGVSDVTGQTYPNLDVANQFLQLFSGTSPNHTTKISWALWDYSDKPNEYASALHANSCKKRQWTDLTCTGIYGSNAFKLKRSKDPTVAPTSIPTSIPSISFQPTSPTHLPSYYPSDLRAVCDLSIFCVNKTERFWIDGWDCDENHFVVNNTVCDNNWQGVECDAQDQVISIDIKNLGFECKLPEAMGHLHQLQYLDVSGNKVIGSLPTSFKSLDQLEHLDLHGLSTGLYKNATSEIALVVSNMSSLKYLDLSDNALTGVVPSSFCESNLETLILSKNDYQCISNCVLKISNLIKDDDLKPCHINYEVDGLNAGKYIAATFAGLVIILVIWYAITSLKFYYANKQVNNQKSAERGNNENSYQQIASSMEKFKNHPSPFSTKATNSAKNSVPTSIESFDRSFNPELSVSL